jgi:hypothetical protein
LEYKLAVKACYEDVVVVSLTPFNIAIVVDIATAVLIILIFVAELVLVVAVGFVVVLLDSIG